MAETLHRLVLMELSGLVRRDPVGRYVRA